MRVYLASGIDNRALALVVEELLTERLRSAVDLRFTSKWYREAPIDDLTARALIDFAAIDQSELVIGLHPGGPGTASELGYALGRGLPVIYLASEHDHDYMPLIAGLYCDPSRRLSWVRNPEELTSEVRAVAETISRAAWTADGA